MNVLCVVLGTRCDSEMTNSVLILGAHKMRNCHISFAGVFNNKTNCGLLPSYLQIEMQNSHIDNCLGLLRIKVVFYGEENIIHRDDGPFCADNQSIILISQTFSIFQNK